MLAEGHFWYRVDVDVDVYVRASVLVADVEPLGSWCLRIERFHASFSLF